MYLLLDKIDFSKPNEVLWYNFANSVDQMPIRHIFTWTKSKDAFIESDFLI